MMVIATLKNDLMARHDLNLLATSFVVARHIRRIPPKPTEGTPAELAHLRCSYDGLRYFTPVTLYEHFSSSSEGILRVYIEVRALEVFVLTVLVLVVHF